MLRHLSADLLLLLGELSDIVNVMAILMPLRQACEYKCTD